MIKTNFKPEHFTGLFPSRIKPVRPGWYQVGVNYAYFDGALWSFTWADPNRIDERRLHLIRLGVIPFQRHRWRGLNFDPNALHL